MKVVSLSDFSYSHIYLYSMFKKKKEEKREKRKEGICLWAFMVYLQIEGHFRLNLKKS